MIQRPPPPTLFPYTTLFRSRHPPALTPRIPGVNYAFVIDNRRCIGCHACSVACKAEHEVPLGVARTWVDRKSTRLNSSHGYISYAVFCLKKKSSDHERRPQG